MVTAKKRLLTALDGGRPDRLPVTTHHLMSYFLNKYTGGMNGLDFHKQYGFDPVVWSIGPVPNEAKGQYLDAASNMICDENWRVTVEDVPDKSYKTTRYHIHTPGGELTSSIGGNEVTEWVTERLIKNEKDMELYIKYCPHYYADIEGCNRLARQVGEDALVRGAVVSAQPYGQPGVFQDLACLMGIEELILACYDDPDWVKEAESAILERKLTFARSLKGANMDLIEDGGGDGSCSVISPKMFLEFVQPFDAPVVEELHRSGIRVVYHTCGKMMPILEDIADMGVDAMETFTPVGMGADADLREAKRRIGRRVCMIGGFDQSNDLHGCSEQQTRDAVRRCFDEAGENGAFILSPSDHFFDVDLDLIRALTDEAHKCIY